MNKQMNKKLYDYIMNLSYMSLPFGGSKWDSSAKKLQDDLAARGIEKKLFYSYKLPGNMSHQEFQDRIALENFVRNFYSDFFGRIMRDKNLTLSEKMKIAGYVWKMRRDKQLGNMNSWEQEIRAKNPELEQCFLRVAKSALVYGALFGFAPNEIKYFAGMQRDMKMEHNLDEKLKGFGIDTSYVLNPDTAKAILAALQKLKE